MELKYARKGQWSEQCSRSLKIILKCQECLYITVNESQIHCPFCHYSDHKEKGREEKAEKALIKESLD